MNPLRWAVLRLRAVVARRALERDMQEEMRAHLERATERLMARGMSPADARSAARREFGNVASLQEEGRDARGARWVSDVAADVRFALRHFARHKLAAATIVTVLALGIGVNTALFSFVQAWLFRPAPAMPRDDAHARIWGLEQPTRGARWGVRGFTYPELRALRERTQTFAAIAGWTGHDVVLDPGDSTGARGIAAEFVTPNFFAVLGVPLAAGPGFLQEQQPAGAPDLAVVMSFALAEELYGAPASAVGRRVLINEVPVRIAGVAVPRFQGALPNDDRPALWLPISARAEIARVSPRWLEEGGALTLLARLAPASTHEQATAVARQVVAQMLPESAARVGLARTAEVLPIRALPPLGVQGDGVVAIAMLGSIALLILLVACSNVSSLMVAAAVGRRQEIAVRLSLGASRGRLVRQLVTESSLLALTGGAAGLLLYWWFVMAVANRDPALQQIDLTPDLGTLAFMMAFALGTGILFGLSPALHATRTGVAGALRDSGSGATHRSRLQRVFVAAQIVFSQPLLVLLALMLSAAWLDSNPLPRSVSEHVVRIGFTPVTVGGVPGQRREAVDSLIPRISAHPEVVGVVPEAAAFAVREIPASAPRDTAVPTSVHLEGAVPGYLALLGVPIVLGRDVSLADTAQRDVAAVVGSDLARALWGEANPIGRTISSPARRGTRQDSISLTVVGVYDAARPTTRGNSVARVYTAHGKSWRRDVLLVRTRSSAEPFIPELRRLIRAEAPTLPVTSLETLAHVDADARRTSLQIAAALGGAGTLALLLASIGLYGVVALAVRQRTREIGIRIAIGAPPARVARMFLAYGMRVSVVALVLGLPLTLVGLRVMVAEGLLLTPPINFWLVGLGIAAILLLVAGVATWLPARRAALVDPARTLRVE